MLACTFSQAHLTRAWPYICNWNVTLQKMMRTGPRDVVQWTWPYTSLMAPLCIQTHVIIRLKAIISQPSFAVLTLGYLNIFPTSSLPTFLHLHCNERKKMKILKKEWLSPWLYDFHSIVDFFFYCCDWISWTKELRGGRVLGVLWLQKDKGHAHHGEKAWQQASMAPEIAESS